MKRIAIILCSLLLATGLFWLFPLFHVVRLDQVEAARQQAAFDAAKFARSFWAERLKPWLDRPPDDTTLLVDDYRKDPKKARDKFGRKVGVSRAHLLVLRGKGTITTVDGNGVSVTSENEGGGTDVVLHTGLLFGNTVRDASGLLDAGDFPNSQQFNDVSTELNAIVEAQVISQLKKQAAPGRTIQFIGCTEISDASAEVPRLKIIPLSVEFD
jgi:predicted lipoprotein